MKDKLDYEFMDGVADVADLGALKEMLLEGYDKLVPEAPRTTRRNRRNSNAYLDALTAWEEQRDMVHDLIKKFANYVDREQEQYIHRCHDAREKP